MGVSNLLGNDVLTYVLKGDYVTWVALHTAEPVPGGATSEVTGTNYARQLVNATNWTTPSNKVSSTNITLTFPTAGSNWGTVTYVAIWDAETAGNLLWWGPLVVPRSVDTGETLSFSTGSLSTTAA